MQKQHPELAEQAPPHEIASAALRQKQQQKEQQTEQQTQQQMADAAHSPEPERNPKQEPAAIAI